MSPMRLGMPDATFKNKARFEVIGALNGQRVGARNVAHIKKVAFGFKIADLQHRIGQPGFNPRDLHRERRDRKSFGLASAV
jgi:hypothetical protein